MKIIANIELKQTSDGGRKNPIYSGYRPTFRLVGNKSSDCVITILMGYNIKPGEKGEVEIEILHPYKLEGVTNGDPFIITEGHNVVASGNIIEIKKNYNMTEHVKLFNENWRELFKSDDDVDDSNRFKKSYDERTLAENILVHCLTNIEFIYTKDNRFLGAAEAVLIMEDFIKPGSKFDYEKKENKFLFMKFETRENYRDLMIRLIKTYLKERGVL